LTGIYRVYQTRTGFRHPKPALALFFNELKSIHLVILNQFKMGNLLYIIAVVLIVIWAIGFFGYAAGGLIHILLVIALILFLLKVIRREA
jgi:hypothetical protein